MDERPSRPPPEDIHPEGTRPPEPPPPDVYAEGTVSRETSYTVRRDPPPPGTPLWLWLIPLVLVVVALVWFIFTQGEPRAPIPGGGVDPAPTTTSPGTTIEVPRIEIQRDPPATEPAPAATPAPVPAEPEPAAAPADP